MVVPRVRRSSFSLEYQEIQPSAAFDIRRRIDLREEGFAWVPDLRSFFKLLEVGVSPYLVLFPLLSTLRMFRLVDALNGRLIGSKPWN